MTDRELMQQALDELEGCEALLIQFGAPHDSCIGATAIDCGKVADALRERLAQPEQEPVARVTSSGPNNFPLLQWLSADHSFRCAIGDLLYTTPPQRTLVGLTLEEVLETYRGPSGSDYVEYARAIEAKLKEKNA